jgi:hypothetical protein
MRDDLIRPRILSPLPEPKRRRGIPSSDAVENHSLLGKSLHCSSYVYEYFSTLSLSYPLSGSYPDHDSSSVSQSATTDILPSHNDVSPSSPDVGALNVKVSEAWSVYASSAIKMAQDLEADGAEDAPELVEKILRAQLEVAAAKMHWADACLKVVETKIQVAEAVVPLDVARIRELKDELSAATSTDEAARIAHKELTTRYLASDSSTSTGTGTGTGTCIWLRCRFEDDSIYSLVFFCVNVPCFPLTH